MTDRHDIESNSQVDPFLDRPVEEPPMGSVPPSALEAQCSSARRGRRHAAQVILVARQFHVTRVQALCDEHAREEIWMLDYFMETHRDDDEPFPGSYKLISLDLAGQILRDTESDVEYEEDEPDQ